MNEETKDAIIELENIAEQLMCIVDFFSGAQKTYTMEGGEQTKDKIMIYIEAQRLYLAAKEIRADALGEEE